jgi:hypothetical protein
VRQSVADTVIAPRTSCPDMNVQTGEDGHLLYCAYPMMFPVVGYHFDDRNCDGCDRSSLAVAGALRNNVTPRELSRGLHVP